MIAQEQTVCPKCKLEYCELNPPRLLTMCGHTFCQKCIKQNMVKKKMNNKYKIVCPLDKMGIEMQNFNANGFPKNLSVLSMVKKKIENCLADNRMSNIVKCGSDFGSGKTLESIQGHLLSHSIILNNEEIDQIKSTKFSQKTISQDTCLLHQKPLQLVCTRDYQKICASCVIFGEHRGHNVKNVHQVQQIVKKVHEKLRNYQLQEQLCFEKLSSKQVTHRLQNLLTFKKTQLSKQISNKFKILLEEVLHLQRKTMGKLDKKIEEYRHKFQANLNQKIAVREKYRDWQDNLSEKIQFLQCDNEEQKIKTALKSDKFVELSDRNLQIMKSLQKNVIEQGQKLIDNLVINSDIEQLKKHLKDYCKFEDCANSFLDMTASRMSQILNQQILLDNIQETSFSVSLLQEAEKLQESGKLKKTVGCMSVASGIFQNAHSRLNRIKSTNKQRTESPNRKNSNLKSNRTLFLGTQKLNTGNRLKDIPPKFQQKIQTVLTGQSDILDLTNGQLSNDKVLSILQHTKQSQVTIIKLVRNKLTDDFLIKSLPYLNNAVMLNLSRNELTDKSLQAIMQARKNGGLVNLKSLMIGQNRIVERKNKDIFEELKKTGVNVCI